MSSVATSMSGTTISFASEPQRVADLWFESDPLVIRAGNRLFRVSPSQLGKRAKALGDILSMPTNGSETYEGCPIVELQDDTVEVEAFLRALFDPLCVQSCWLPLASHSHLISF